jgi:carbamoyl-phosphate synthase large subunit
VIKAMITGIGGTNSIAVLKALNLSKTPHRSIGTDIKPLNAGSYLTDESFLIPSVSNEKEYRAGLEKIIRTKHINIIFATTETELYYLAKIKPELEKHHKLVVMVPDLEILSLCQDKLKTQEFLRTNGFTYIPTIVPSSADEIAKFVTDNGFPLIQKPIHGYGSRGVSVINCP